MQLQVERSGGFAGRTVRWSLDVDALEPERQAEVHELLEQAPAWGGSSGPDRFSYRVSVAGAGSAPGSGAPGPAAAGPFDVRFAEPLPEPARRLLEVVREGPDAPL